MVSLYSLPLLLAGFIQDALSTLAKIADQFFEGGFSERTQERVVDQTSVKIVVCLRVDKKRFEL